MCISIVNIILTINKNGTTLDRINDFAAAAITPPLASFPPSFLPTVFLHFSHCDQPPLPPSLRLSLPDGEGSAVAGGGGHDGTDCYPSLCMWRYLSVLMGRRTNRPLSSSSQTTPVPLCFLSGTEACHGVAIRHKVEDGFYFLSWL